MPAIPRTQFEFELRKILAEEIECQREKLETNNYETVADFKYTMGRLYQLRQMDELMEEAQTRLNKRNS